MLLPYLQGFRTDVSLCFFCAETSGPGIVSVREILFKFFSQSFEFCNLRGVLDSKPEKLNNFFCFVTLFHNFSQHSSPSALYTFCSAHTTAGKRRRTLFGRL